MINEEKIKSLNTEELADFICRFTDCNCCFFYRSGGCKYSLEQWLKSEAEQ